MFLFLDTNQMNNVAQSPALISQPYPAVGQIISPYEQQTPLKDLNKYTTLKTVGEKLFIWRYLNIAKYIFQKLLLFLLELVFLGGKPCLGEVLAIFVLEATKKNVFVCKNISEILFKSDFFFLETQFA